MTLRTCYYCRTLLVGKRADARYCDAECYDNARRGKPRPAQPPAPKAAGTCQCEEPMPARVLATVEEDDRRPLPPPVSCQKCGLSIPQPFPAQKPSPVARPRDPSPLRELIDALDRNTAAHAQPTHANGQALEAPYFLTRSQLALRWGWSQALIAQHDDEIGAKRAGTGSKPRIYYPRPSVEAFEAGCLKAEVPEPEPPPNAPRRKPQRKQSEVKLLAVKEKKAA